MSGLDDLELPEGITGEMIEVLLKEEAVQDILKEFLTANDVEAPLEALPQDAQATLLAALIADGAITITSDEDGQDEEE